MCEWNTVEILTIKNKPVAVDSCIAPIVKSLNDSGIETVASCCGHGKRPGNIALKDGREIFIIPNFETGRLTDKFLNSIGFKPIND
jgi:hypothetical protein